MVDYLVDRRRRRRRRRKRRKDEKWPVLWDKRQKALLLLADTTYW